MTRLYWIVLFAVALGCGAEKPVEPLVPVFDVALETDKSHYVPGDTIRASLVNYGNISIWTSDCGTGVQLVDCEGWCGLGSMCNSMPPRRFYVDPNDRYPILTLPWTGPAPMKVRITHTVFRVDTYTAEVVSHEFEIVAP